MSQTVRLRSSLNLAANNSSVFSSVLSVAFCPITPLLATGCVDNTVKLWRFEPNGSAATCVATLRGHSGCVWSVAFHPTAPLLATCSIDNTAKLWSFSPDSSAVTCVATLVGHSDGVYSVAFHPTAPLLATGLSNNTAKLWRFEPDGSAATCVATLEGHSSEVNSVAFCPIAPLLATGSYDNTAKLWRFSPDGTAANNMLAVCVATVGHSNDVLSVAFHPTASLLATGVEDKTAKLWRFSPDGSESNNMQATCVATLEGHRWGVLSVAFHPTAPLLATGSADKTVKLWRLSSDESSATCVATLEGHSSIVNSVAFHPIAPLLATGSEDNTAKIWELNIENILRVPSISSASANDSGLTISRNKSGTIKIKIKKKLLNPTTNRANKSCPNFMHLYEKIMAINLDSPFKFEFEGQNAVDLTGLTRIVFDRLLPIYTNLFFEQSIKSTFILLKEKVDEKLLNEHTEQIIKLAKAAKSQIVLGIDPALIDLLLSSDLKKYFNKNKRYKFEKFYNNINKTIQNNSFNELNNNNTFLRINKNENGKNRVIYKYKTQEKQEIYNMLLSEIRLRRFLSECGFNSWDQVQNMYVFIHYFWNTSNENKIIFYKNRQEVRFDLFVSELNLDVESFKRRIKIIKEDTRQILDLRNLTQELFGIYPAFHPLLEYILDESKEGNENRKTFVKYVTGTEYSPAELLIKLTDETMMETLYGGQPFYGHSCSNTIDLFKASKGFNGKITKNIINTQLKATTSNNSNIRAAER